MRKLRVSTTHPPIIFLDSVPILWQTQDLPASASDGFTHSFPIAKPLQPLLLPPPVFGHFHGRFQEDFLLKEVFHSFARFRADAFQGASSFSEIGRAS